MKTISHTRVHFPARLCPVPSCTVKRSNGGSRELPTNSRNIRRFMGRLRRAMADDERDVSLRIVHITAPTGGRGCGWVLGALEQTGNGAVKIGKLVCFGPTFNQAASATNWARKRSLGAPVEIGVNVRKAA